MSIVDGTDNIFSHTGNEKIVQPVYIPAQPSSIIDTTPRLYSRQLLSGNMRGAQNITGTLTVVSPQTNKPVISLDGTSGVIQIGSDVSTSKQNISLDGINEAITVTNTDGSVVGMGKLPDGTGFGFFAQDSSGNLLYKIVGSTIYAYDVSQSPALNVMQILKLPDGTYGWAVAAQGKNVVDGIA